ncbi:MAG: SurA N-terminal domain-containing protein [Spirochaetes bacterium]|nr:SurA N-terminal domain-containing protein [Spirochaetota bacterium]
MKMLKNVFIFTLVLVLFIGVYSCSNNKNWVAKIEGEKISLEEFNTRFEYYLKSKYMQAQRPDLIPQARNSMEERKAALKDMINERLILKEARKLKLHKREEVQSLMKLYTQQIILNAYIEEYLAGDIQVEEEEIMEFYNKNRNDFRNMDPDMAKRRIKYQLMMQKYDRKIMEVLAQLKNKYRIDENESAIRPIVSEKSVMDGTGQMPGKGMNMPQMPTANIKKTEPAPAPEAPKTDEPKAEEKTK